MKKLVVVVLLMGVSLFVGCGGSSSNSGGGNTTPTLVGISVTPATPSITNGATQQFTATGSYSDGTTKNLTSTANWLSSVTTVATIKHFRPRHWSGRRHHHDLGFVGRHHRFDHPDRRRLAVHHRDSREPDSCTQRDPAVHRHRQLQ